MALGLGTVEYCPGANVLATDNPGVIDLYVETTTNKLMGRNDTILFSESAGRFIVTVCPGNRDVFEKLFKGQPCVRVGTVSDDSKLSVTGIDGRIIISSPVTQLRDAWKRPFGGLV